jgi:hypothetical protein
LISFLMALSGFSACFILVLMVNQYSKHLKEISFYELPLSISTNGYRLAAFSASAGLFFIFRIFFIIQNNKDFDPRDWLIYDCAIGFYMLYMCIFLYRLFKERQKIDARTQHTTRGVNT